MHAASRVMTNYAVEHDHHPTAEETSPLFWLVFFQIIWRIVTWISPISVLKYFQVNWTMDGKLHCLKGNLRLLLQNHTSKNFSSVHKFTSGIFIAFRTWRPSTAWLPLFSTLHTNQIWAKIVFCWPVKSQFGKIYSLKKLQEGTAWG